MLNYFSTPLFSTHTPRCLTPTRRFFVSAFWVRLWVLGLFRIFHAHITMLNAHPTIFFRVLGLFASFGFVSNIPRTHHGAQRPPDDFLFATFGFVSQFWVCFEHSMHTPRCSTPTRRFFVCEFWVCFEHSTHRPRCPTPTPLFLFPSFRFACEFWVCFEHSTHTPLKIRIY